MTISRSFVPSRVISFLFLAGIVAILPACSDDSSKPQGDGGTVPATGGAAGHDSGLASDTGLVDGAKGSGGATGSDGGFVDTSGGQGSATTIDASAIGFDASSSSEAGASETRPVDVAAIDSALPDTKVVVPVDASMDAPAMDVAVAADTQAIEVAIDTSAPSGDCLITFTNTTSNLSNPSVPMTSVCTAMQFGTAVGDSQFNFLVDDIAGGTTREFNIDWFDIRAPVGTSLKVEDGYDIAASKGINVSYMESTAVNALLWTGDTGTVTLKAVSGTTYTVELTSVHFTPMPDSFNSNTATGSFVVNGTITATLQ